MLPHQERVVAEKDDLLSKLSKLESFVEGDTFQTLPEAERLRLLEQSKYMAQYYRILSERIAAFPAS